MVGWGKSILRYGAVILVIGLLWKFAAIALGGVILPHPEEAVRLFFFAMTTKLFWEHFLVSAYRAVSGMALGWGWRSRWA